MKGPNGKPFDSYLKVNANTGQLQHFQENPNVRRNTSQTDNTQQQEQKKVQNRLSDLNETASFIVVVQKLLLGKIRWRYAKLIFEDLTEMGIATKPRLINYFRDIHIRMLQQISRLVQSHISDEIAQ